jgi:Protein of unknown function (DUF4065)
MDAINKTRSVVLMLSTSLLVENLGISKLVGLMFYIDMLAQELFGSTISSRFYLKTQYGLIMHNSRRLIQDLVDSKSIEVRSRFLDVAKEYQINEIHGIAEYDVSLFNAKEIKIIEEVMQKFGNLSAWQLNALINREYVVIGSRTKEPLDLELLKIKPLKAIKI